MKPFPYVQTLQNERNTTKIASKRYICGTSMKYKSIAVHGGMSADFSNKYHHPSEHTNLSQLIS
jgi:hypothetical protein